MSEKSMTPWEEIPKLEVEIKNLKSKLVLTQDSCSALAATTTRLEADLAEARKEREESETGTHYYHDEPITTSRFCRMVERAEAAESQLTQVQAALGRAREALAAWIEARKHGGYEAERLAYEMAMIAYADTPSSLPPPHPAPAQENKP